MLREEDVGRRGGGVGVGARGWWGVLQNAIVCLTEIFRLVICFCPFSVASIISPS